MNEHKNIITNEFKLEKYWSELPIGKANAVSYAELIVRWGRSERDVRKILHDLSCYDNGDDYILIRSSKKGGGFYKTNNPDEMKEYRRECLAKGKSVFAPVKKINRVLNNNTKQFEFENNLRVRREAAELTQAQVCNTMKYFDESFDVPLLSKMENGVCLPTFFQLGKLATLYQCDPNDLINYGMI